MTIDRRPTIPVHAPRRLPRTEVEGRILLRDASKALSLEIFDISTDGIQVRSPRPLAIGERQALLANVRPGVVLELRATVVHCASWAGRHGQFRVGMAFAPDARTVDNVGVLIDSVTALPPVDGDRASV